MALKNALTLTAALVLVIFATIFTPVFADYRVDIPDQTQIYEPENADTVLVSGDTPTNQWRSSLVWVVADHVYTAKRGDNLTHIAKLFNVPFDEVISTTHNPIISARKNKNLIYVGEKINIPLLRRELKPVDEVTNTELVILMKDELVQILDQSDRYAARIKGLENSNAAKTNLELALFTAILVLIVGLITIHLIHLEKRGQAVQHFPRNVSKHETMKMLKALPGSELTELLDETLAADEVGNPVAFKNAKDFLAKGKREY